MSAFADLATKPSGAPVDSLAAEVRHYLRQTPRQLPSRALYDALGSALFDAICHLPWYPITRAERRLLAAHRAQVFGAAGWPDRVIELGGGNGEKLALLVGPREAGAPEKAVRRIDLVDVSASSLGAASRLLHDVHQVPVVAHQAAYEAGLAEAVKTREGDERLLVLFLGSNIGNFDPPAALRFLAMIHKRLRPDDALLIGMDLVKPESVLLSAYDDPLGVTAAFNKNLLVHLNRELGADFDVTEFDHRAVWNAEMSRVEMHLVSRVRQTIAVPQSGLTFELQESETIWTESSYKYDVAAANDLLVRAGFDPTWKWIDEEGQFLLTLARVSS